MNWISSSVGAGLWVTAQGRSVVPVMIKAQHFQTNHHIQSKENCRKHACDRGLLPWKEENHSAITGRRIQKAHFIRTRISGKCTEVELKISKRNLWLFKNLNQIPVIIRKNNVHTSTGLTDFSSLGIVHQSNGVSERASCINDTLGTNFPLVSCQVRKYIIQLSHFIFTETLQTNITPV